MRRQSAPVDLMTVNNNGSMHLSKPKRIGSILYFFLCAALSLGITIANEYAHKGVVVAYLVPPLTTASSSTDVVSGFGQCDPSSYVTEAGIILAGKDPRKDVYIKVWAPGFPIVEAGVLKLSKKHFVRNMFILTAIVWAISIGLCCVALRDISGSILFPFLLLLMLSTHLFGDYLLNEGILYSETIGIAIFMPVMIYFCAGWARSSIRQVALSAIGMIVIGFIRSQFLLVVEVCLCAMALYTTALAVLRRFGHLVQSVSVRPVLLALFMLFTAINAYAMWNDGEFVHDEYFYRLPWRVQNPPDMFDTGGMNVLCQADGKTCDRMRAMNNEDDEKLKKTQGDAAPIQHENWSKNRQAVIHTIVTRPLRIFWTKFHYFVRYFFSDPLSVPDPNSGFSYLYLENALFAIFGIVSLIGCFVFRRIRFFQALGFFLVFGWFGSCIVSFTVIHFEVRYLFFGKALDCVVFSLVMAYVCRLARQNWAINENRVFVEDNLV